MRAYVSEKADAALTAYLRSEGAEITFVDKHADVSPAIDCHPDVYYCQLGDRIYEGDPSKLGPEYPSDVLYNAAAVGKYLICSRHTSEDLIESSGLIPVCVPQGYVKCNLVVVDDSHVITEDAGIARILTEIKDINCLCISPKGVILPGYPCGFIGGCSGRLGDKIIFHGDLSLHKDFKKICGFIEACGLEPLYFQGFPLTDIGSILFEKSC